MKIHFNLLIIAVVYFISIKNVVAQTISLAASGTTVESGGIIKISASGENNQKKISTFGHPITNNSDVQSSLWNTSYYLNTSNPSTSEYKFINNTNSPITLNVQIPHTILTIPSSGPMTFTPQTFNFNVTVSPKYPINISKVSKDETVLIGSDCGFPHAYGTWYNTNGMMEYNVWKFIFIVEFTNSSSTISDSDIYWEWEVEDPSAYFYNEKQFLVYPYGATKQTPLNGEKKVAIEANDRLDEYSSRVVVRAKSKTSGTILSPDFFFSVAAVDH
ncbi:hypothetical protein [Pedobacter insulae]|uniref:Uncharacterized protein n=1 Tax=Pedobacter insulae TaxID=414048 RepID=A0A1I2XZ11_9SPHI|nr:hypothetical protein [Pedobacter insulae]SFH18602.1 hypothetical protein SAMN04489864_106126 [Pedobacter insulae]